MKLFINQDFILETNVAKSLLHEGLGKRHIVDYQFYLDQKVISENKNFRNLTHLWLDGDHYKWRAMRKNGVSEKYCNWNKFEKWAETV
ncbi:glucuronate isomerase [Polaribacter staleyi]|uniref:glucuronate isomerase n=1 Tax=Polaribacter staleyi TaxID=2022337 RepID=UPI0031BBACB8